MSVTSVSRVYLVGIGGIGMSALARFFASDGKVVAGYDRTPTELTDALVAEGLAIHFEDAVANIPSEFKVPSETLVIYTPAIPADSAELNWFRGNGFTVLKRSEVLGELSKGKNTIAISGTHGKTTITTFVSHLLTHSGMGCGAFLGGISKNYGTNLLTPKGSNNLVVEADEYDRSFLKLFPNLAVVTSVDADHLDIYGTYEAIVEAFSNFVGQIKSGGSVVVKKGINLKVTNSQIKTYTYSLLEDADFHIADLRVENGVSIFTLVSPMGRIENVNLHLPGKVNLENAVAASALALLSGVSAEKVRLGVGSFLGVKRRFDTRFKGKGVVLVDDYAHHPVELKAAINAMREAYPGKKVTGVFQPHLFSRTRDFADDFAASLSLVDELFLLDIYPARELPIAGVTSQMLLDRVTLKNKQLIGKEELVEVLSKRNDLEVLIMMGAGDIDKLVAPLQQIFEKR